jgi:proteasome inhibitor subunit 1 (PI31)
VKCLAMHDKLLVDALADEAAEQVHLQISVGDYAVESRGTNCSSQFKNLGELVKIMDAQLVSKLDGSSKPNSSSLEASEASRSNITIGVPIGRPSGPQTHPSGMTYPPINPISGSDLFPGPGAGMYPTRGDFGIGGSMLLGPNDPPWHGGVRGDPVFPGGQTGVPPGVRFDPYGPPDVPGFEPNHFARTPRRPGNGTHPDLEHFGSGSDFI